MVNAQEWLEENYPKSGTCVRKENWGENHEDFGKKREEITELDIRSGTLEMWLIKGEFKLNLLEGELNLNDFTNLKELDCRANKLTSLDLTNCENLEKIDCSYNRLTNLVFPNSCPNMTELSISDINFSQSDLSIFSPFTNLRVLKIGNDDKERIELNFYNRFFGSLKPLKNLTKLRKLHISNTDINSGWEYLPVNIEEIDCSSQVRPESKVKEIAEQLYWIVSKQTNSSQLKSWIDYGFQPQDCGFASYLTRQGYQSQDSFNLEELKKEYYDKSQKSQEWLDKNYPKEKRSEIKEIHLNEPSLEGELDLRDFTYSSYPCLRIYISPQVDETKLTFINLSKDAKISLINAQRDIDYHYPTKEQREKITELNIWNKKLEGTLDLSDFKNLERLYCWDNKLTSLNLSNCSQLEEIICKDNLLTNVTLPTNPSNLKYLDLSSNNLSQDLSFLTPATNLKYLRLERNNFTGSLEPLKHLIKLEEINIEDTDVDSGLEYLPRSLKRIYCDSYRSATSCRELAWSLSPYKGPSYGEHLGLNYYDYQSWKRANQGLVNQTNQKLANEKLLSLIYLTGLWGSKNTNSQLTQKAFKCVVFYLKEEVIQLQKELYQAHQETSLYRW